MLTTNALERTFQLRLGTATATCFTFDHEQRQYVITAKHVINDIRSEPQTVVELFHDNQWKRLTLTLVGHCPDPIDISVYSPPQLLSPPLHLPPQDRIIYGHRVYFLGFPYGLRSNAGEINRGFPMPFIKQGIISSVGGENGTCIFLDGHNNPGFSGGPVVAENPKTNRFDILAVISGYRAAPEEICDATGPVGLYYQANTGIITSYSIKHALDVIVANPTGFEISA